MKLTTKSQVTIPARVREILGLVPNSEIEFKEENGRVYIVKSRRKNITKRLRKYRGVAKVKMSTEEIMQLTRDSE